MNLCVDQGNSRTKVAVFEQNVLQKTFVFEQFTDTEFSSLLEQFPIKRCIISSVRNICIESFDFVTTKVEKMIFLNHNTPIPVQNRYETPETLGKDRLAAIVGANYLKPNDNILVIDAGTAITYDYINDKSQYLGGNIAPGLNMRCKALHSFTQKLPLVNPNDEIDNAILGRNTFSAIQKGVSQGLIYEIEGYISELNAKNANFSVFLTGGDANYFFNRLKSPTFVEIFLVLIGLNRILEYNA